MVDIERYDYYTESQIAEQKSFKSMMEIDREAKEVFTEAFYDRLLACDTFQESPLRFNEERLRAYQKAIHRLFEPLDVSDRCTHRDIIKPVEISLGYRVFDIDVQNYRIYKNIFGKERKRLCGREISKFVIPLQITFAQASNLGLIQEGVTEEDFRETSIVRDLDRALVNLRIALKYEEDFCEEKAKEEQQKS